MIRKSIRAKKRNNAHTLTIRTRWAKITDPAYFNSSTAPYNIIDNNDYFISDEEFDDLFDEFDEEFNEREITNALYNTTDAGEISDEVDEFFKDPEIVEYITNLWNAEDEEVLA